MFEIDYTLFLSPAEVIELTHKKHRDAQAQALRSMGINHRIRPDGTVAVLRAYLDEVFDAKATKNAIIKRQIEPDWEALRAKKT